jgi:hypothetical protein
MTVHWWPLLLVIAVSVSTTVVVVVLVTLALLGLSARATRAATTHRAPTPHPLFAPVTGTAVAGACLAAAAMIVAFGIWTIVAT